jgi:hypothetical protein
VSDSDTEVAWGSLRKRAEDATKPPEPGWYVLECTKAENKKAQSSGNPMIAAQFKIVEGPAAGKTGIFNNFNLTVDNDFAMSIFFRNMEAFGIDAAFFETNPSLDFVAQSLVGRRANVELGIRTWQGQPRPQFENIRPIDGQMPVVGAPNVGPSVTSPGGGMSGSVPPTPSIPSATPVVGATPSASPATPPALPF